uniref:Uncharacterized protein n=1 Tax=Glossina brevipalpis TaxID=37001 RepID=A0A1A9WJL5_9MUSC
MFSLKDYKLSCELVGHSKDVRSVSTAAPSRTLLLVEIVTSRSQLIMSYRHTGIQIHSHELLVIIPPPIIRIQKCRKVCMLPGCDNKGDNLIKNYLKDVEKHFPLSAHLTFDAYDRAKVVDRLSVQIILPPQSKSAANQLMIIRCFVNVTNHKAGSQEIDAFLPTLNLFPFAMLSNYRSVKSLQNLACFIQGLNQFKTWSNLVRNCRMDASACHTSVFPDAKAVLVSQPVLIMPKDIKFTPINRVL